MLNMKSLREQVYEYLREEMHRGRLVPGTALNLTAISEQLGISKTPLRDALIQLESEGFVTIMPRRCVLVNRLTLREVKDAYEIAGALEGAVVVSVFEQLRQPEKIAALEKLNQEMRQRIKKGDFHDFFELNLNFHNVFVNLSDNKTLHRVLTPLKHRLYDFPRRGYLKEWEWRNCDEHDEFIRLVKEGDRYGAAAVLREVHWSFQVQEQYIREFYGFPKEDEDEVDLCRASSANG